MTITIDETKKLLKLASTASVLVAVFLLLIKIVAYWLTDSVSIMASLLDSLLDIVASLINFFAIRVALMPADKEHPFGHGKAEAIAGLAQATFIASSAIFLLFQAYSRLQHPAQLAVMDIGIVIMIISMVTTGLLIMLQRYVISRTNSVAIRADSMHYFTDLLTNSMIIVALLMVNSGWPWMDGAMAMLMSVYILYSAWQIIWESIQLLLDRELSEDIQQSIKNIVLSDQDVNAIHELKTREAGHTKFIQLHIEMDGTMSLNRAHVISDRIMASLLKEFPSAEILIHQDPHNDTTDPELRILRE